MKTVKINRRDFVLDVVNDDSPDTSYLEQEGFEDRRAEYEAGAFGFFGIRAAVVIPVPYGADHIDATIRSPGLWGIESDCGDDYIREVFEEQCAVLAEMLEGLNIRVAS